MSAPDKPDLARGGRLAEELFEQESDRLAEMSDADFERAMDKLPDVEHVPSADELLERVKQKARERAAPEKVIALPEGPGPSHWVLWLVAAVVGAGGIALVVERREVLAWLRNNEAPIEPDRWAPPRELTAVERAEKLRGEAEAACKGALWGLCAQKLDEAQKLDPAGESGALAQALREAVREHTELRDFDPKRKPGAP